MSKIIKFLLLLVGLSLPSSATAVTPAHPEQLGERINILPMVIVAFVSPSLTSPEDSSIEMNFTAGGTGAEDTQQQVQNIYALNISLAAIYNNAPQ